MQLRWLLVMWVLSPALVYAHHGSAGGLGGGAAASSPLVNSRGRLSLTNSRLQWDQQLLRVEQTPTFNDPVTEDALWWWSQFGATWAWAIWGEAFVSTPLAVRVPQDGGESTDAGLGDIQFGARFFPLHTDSGDIALGAGSELLLPTGKNQPGFSTHAWVQRVMVTARFAVANDLWLIGIESGMAWAYASDTQIAVDYRASLFSPAWYGWRALAELQGQTFFIDSNVALQALPSAERNAGDTTLTVNPGLSWSVPDLGVVLLQTRIPITSEKDFDWGVLLSLQYWFAAPS